MWRIRSRNSLQKLKGVTNCTRGEGGGGGGGGGGGCVCVFLYLRTLL